MIKINIENEIRKDIEKGHYDDIWDRTKSVIKEIINYSKYSKLKSYLYNLDDSLNEERLKKIVIGDKNDLCDIIKNVGEIELEKDDYFEQLYTNFTKRNWAKSLLEKLDVKICPYCNRQYTFTLKSHGIRPQFDHYFPKSKYAYLCVSLYNLIPCCSICNSKKHDLDTYNYDNQLFYPYDDEFGYNVVFETEIRNYDILCWNGTSDNFDIKLKCKNKDKDLLNKIENINRHLKIDLLYKQHKDYVKDIIRNAALYNDSRVTELLEQFPDIFQSESDVLNSIFMNYVDKNSWGRRPLAKLTHDIYYEYKINNREKY